LIQELLKVNPKASLLPVRPSNTDAYFAAIGFEAARPPNGAGKTPSLASNYAVARHIRQQSGMKFRSQKTAETQVRGWRGFEHYRSTVNLLRTAAKHQDAYEASYLPPVGAHFVIDKSDLARLPAYARALVAHLRNIRSGQKANGYPITKIRTAAFCIVEAYIAASAALAPDAAQLMRELLKADRQVSTLPVRLSNAEAYFAAIEFEAAYPPEPSGQAPSRAPRYAVAVRMLKKSGKKFMSQKTAEGQIRGWRKLEHYQANVILQRPASLKAKS
jgi:hypothetical protein